MEIWRKDNVCFGSAHDPRIGWNGRSRICRCRWIGGCITSCGMAIWRWSAQVHVSSCSVRMQYVATPVGPRQTAIRQQGKLTDKRKARSRSSYSLALVEFPIRWDRLLMLNGDPEGPHGWFVPKLIMSFEGAERGHSRQTKVGERLRAQGPIWIQDCDKVLTVDRA